MMILAMTMVMTISAKAMSYNAAKNEALFLSDKMAYELNLTAAQYEAVYEINLDYLMSLNGHGDVFGIWWDRRHADLRYVLNSWQYDKYVALSHFYRPVAWKAALVLLFVSILPSLFPGSVRIACRPVQSARRTSFLGEPSICGRRRVPDRLPCVLESLSRRPMLSSCTCFP